MPINPELIPLAKAGCPELAVVLSQTPAHDHIRGMWDDIDQSVQIQENDLVERVFAGMSADGQRYVEVYRRGSDPTRFRVFSGSPLYTDSGLFTNGIIEGGLLGEVSENGDFTIGFNDPASSAQGVPAELHLRPSEMGTSSYYGRVGDTDSYDTEFLPIAQLQPPAGLYPDNPDNPGILRTTALDNGQPIAGGLRIYPSPLQPS